MSLLCCVHCIALHLQAADNDVFPSGSNSFPFICDFSLNIYNALYVLVYVTGSFNIYNSSGVTRGINIQFIFI